jgi:two-component system phosphate regulon response regulator PhoB
MKKVLVVEDEEDVRELVAFKLSSAGYDVTVAVDGEEGLAQARRIRPDLVLLDWMTPRLNGLDAAIAMRADPELAAIPVILLTAKSQERDVERGFSAGIDDYIVKPFSPKELLSRIEAVLARVRISK